MVNSREKLNVVRGKINFGWPLQVFCLSLRVNTSSSSHQRLLQFVERFCCDIQERKVMSGVGDGNTIGRPCIWRVVT